MTAPLLRVDDLHTEPADSAAGPLLTGLNLTVAAGEVHAILGAASSTTSTLGPALLGSNSYETTNGTVEFRGDDVTTWPTDERAKAGMFLAFQRRDDIPGVSMLEILSRAISARKSVDLSLLDLRRVIDKWIHRLDGEKLPSDERICNEIIQMAVLAPDLAIVDVIEAGLDLNTLRWIARGLSEVRVDNPALGVIVITDDPRLLDEIAPDRLHMMIDGQIVATGGMELAAQFERDHRFQQIASRAATAVAA